MIKLRLWVTCSGHVDIEVPEEIAAGLVNAYDAAGALDLEEVPGVDWDNVVNALRYEVDDLDILNPKSEDDQ